MPSDIEALRNWSKLDKATQKLLLTNVFCVNCEITIMVDYDITMHRFGIILRGKCKQCGHDVARIVEDEWYDPEAR